MYRVNLPKNSLPPHSFEEGPSVSPISAQADILGRPHCAGLQRARPKRQLGKKQNERRSAGK